MIERAVWRKARRARGSLSEASPSAVPRASARVRSPSRLSTCVAAPSTARGPPRVSSGSTHSAPGSVAARSTQPTSLPEPAARDEHEPLDPLGELVGELHRDPAAHRVADHRRALVAERGQQVAQPARVGAERVVAARLGRAAVAEQVRRDHRVALGQRRDHLAPGVGARGDAVDEQQHRAGPRRVVRDGVAVEPQLVPLERAHAGSGSRPGPRRRAGAAPAAGDGGEPHERPRVERDDRERDREHDAHSRQRSARRCRLRLALEDVLVAHERPLEARLARARPWPGSPGPRAGRPARRAASGRCGGGARLPVAVDRDRLVRAVDALARRARGGRPRARRPATRWWSATWRRRRPAAGRADDRGDLARRRCRGRRAAGPARARRAAARWRGRTRPARRRPARRAGRRRARRAGTAAAAPAARRR